MKVPLIDLKSQYAEIQDEISAAIDEVLATQQFILGPQVARFEAAMAACCGVSHAVGVANGSDALILALKAANIQPGDDVITTPFTFFATAGAICHCGARPVFADIDPVTFNLDPARVAAAWTPRTRAIIAVDLFGQCADYDAIRAATPHDLIIEDAAQAIGASDGGRPAGGRGDLATFSFFPTKNAGAYGDAGMVTTSDDGRAARIRRLRVHGSSSPYRYAEIGFNSRLDELQAAVLTVKLRHLDRWTARRREHAMYYTEALRGTGISSPGVRPGATHVYHQYVVRSSRRDELQAFLAGREIGTAVYYPVPLHLQECFRFLGYAAGDFPEAERAAREVLAIPVSPQVTVQQREYVIEALTAFGAREASGQNAGSGSVSRG